MSAIIAARDVIRAALEQPATERLHPGDLERAVAGCVSGETIPLMLGLSSLLAELMRAQQAETQQAQAIDELRARIAAGDE